MAWENTFGEAERLVRAVMEELDGKEKPTQLEAAAVLVLESAIKSIHAAQSLLTIKE